MTEEEIQREGDRLGHVLGWRLMTCPEANLHTPSFAIITLNPGESYQAPPTWSMEDKTVSYFLDEKWEKALHGKSKGGTAPLQIQVQRLAEILNINLREVFSAQFVPFCSPSWDRLPNRAQTLEFCRQLWRWLLPKLSARTIIVVGKGIVAKEFVKLLSASDRQRFVIHDWKGQSIDRYDAPDDYILIALPHLSRYKIFGRKTEGGERALRCALVGAPLGDPKSTHSAL